MNDKLDNLLKTWAPKTYTASDIRVDVWQRIEHTEPSGWRNAITSVMALMMRPTLATGLAALAIMVGVAMGTVASETAQTQAYLDSVTAYRTSK